MNTGFRFLLAVLILVSAFAIFPGDASAKKAVFRTGFTECASAQGGFTAWELLGAQRNRQGELVLDPTTAINEEVQRTYLRAELEPLWLEGSSGLVYLIKP